LEKLKGVLNPVYEEIYEPVLKELKENGINIYEEVKLYFD
jgi:hypothetical protein